MTTDTNNASTVSKKPSHIAYHVRDNKDGKDYWTRIGAAWPHKDGEGFNLHLDVVPLDGNITLRLDSE